MLNAFFRNVNCGPVRVRPDYTGRHTDRLGTTVGDEDDGCGDGKNYVGGGGCGKVGSRSGGHS